MTDKIKKKMIFFCGYDFKYLGFIIKNNIINFSDPAKIKRGFIDLATGPDYNVGLGFQDGMGVIHGSHDFDSGTLHGYAGGNPFSGKIGGGAGFTFNNGIDLSGNVYGNLKTGDVGAGIGITIPFGKK